MDNGKKNRSEIGDGSPSPAWRRIFAFAAPVLAGLGILFWLTSGREPPVQDPPRETAQNVRVITLASGPYRPRAEGFGFVEPSTIWQGVAQVEGRIVEKHTDLARGALLAAGEILFRIDPTDYRIARARAEASLATVEAQRAQLDVEEESLKSLLTVERESLDLARRDVERKSGLAQRGNISQAGLDEARRTLLSQRLRVIDFRNKLAAIETRRQEFAAQRALKRTDLEKSAVDLSRTTIRMPFTGRITSLEAEVQQYVRIGNRLVTATAIDKVEIRVQIPITRFRPLVPRHLSLVGLSDKDLANLFKKVRFTATVRLDQPGFDAEWPGRVERISEEIDQETRSLGLFVAVDDPFRSAIPGKRPPLTKGQFVRVEIAAPLRENRIVVPRTALHYTEGRAVTAYLADSKNRLRRVSVSIAAESSNFAIIEQGLSPGDRIVVSDLIPAVEGMLLAPVEDKIAALHLKAQASGTAPLR